jgi:hypothetical protein
MLTPRAPVKPIFRQQFFDLSTGGSPVATQSDRRRNSLASVESKCHGLRPNKGQFDRPNRSAATWKKAPAVSKRARTGQLGVQRKRHWH